MKHYLYFPFENYKHDNAYVNTKARYKNKYGNADQNNAGEVNKKTFIQGGKGLIGKITKPLKVVKDDDVLIIMAHGDNIDTEEIGVSGKKHYHTMNNNDLAKQLKQEGLSLTHKVIKMVSCYGGGDTRVDPSDMSAHINNSKDFFAKLLAQSMGLLGYASVVVGGYDGVVCTSRLGGKNDIGYEVIDGADISSVPDGYEIRNAKVRQPTKGNANWYDATGSETTRPAKA